MTTRPKITPRPATLDPARVAEFAGTADRKDRPEPSDRKDRKDTARTVRMTLHLPPELVEKLRDVAWWERTPLSTLTRRFLVEGIAGLERLQGGEFAPRDRKASEGRLA